MGEDVVRIVGGILCVMISFNHKFFATWVRTGVTQSPRVQFVAGLAAFLALLLLAITSNRA